MPSSRRNSCIARLTLAAGLVSLLPSAVRALDGAAIFAHTSGIWSLASTPAEQRWLIIHNLEQAKTTGIFHIEVIARKKGAPAWAIKHLADHMAITSSALQRSVISRKASGAVYPEAFDNAYAAWQKADPAQRHVCETSVAQCLSR